MITKHRIISREDFLKDRNDYVNASEVAALFNHGYTPKIKLYFQKIGEPIAEFTGNIYTLAGQDEEPKTADKLRYWNFFSNDALDMYLNKQENKVLNKVRNFNTRFYNKKYPGLACTPDRKIYTHLGEKGWVEIKNTTSMSKGRWKNGIDPSHYLQLQTQLLLTNEKYGFLAYSVDGNNMEVHRIEANVDVQHEIHKESLLFMESVYKARVIKEQAKITTYTNLTNPTLTQEQAILELQALEPETTSSDLDFLREFYKDTLDEDVVIDATHELCKLVEEYFITSKAEEDSIKERRAGFQAKLIHAFGTSNIIKLDDKQYASYKKDSRGVRTLRISNEWKKSFIAANAE